MYVKIKSVCSIRLIQAFSISNEGKSVYQQRQLLVMDLACGIPGGAVV